VTTALSAFVNWLVTGSAVALVRPIQKSIGKCKSTPGKIVTPENYILGTSDYVENITY